MTTTDSSRHGGALNPRPQDHELWSGTYFDFLTPGAETIDPMDIAVALSHQCRYHGHVKRFYSVAEHTCIVAGLITDLTDDPLLVKAAILHDAGEAYTGDVASPLKFALRVLEVLYWNDVSMDEAIARVKASSATVSTTDSLAREVDTAIGLRFDINPALFHHPIVVQADLWALRLEAEQLVRSEGRNWSWPSDDDHPIYTFWPPQLLTTPPHYMFSGGMPVRRLGQDPVPARCGLLSLFMEHKII